MTKYIKIAMIKIWTGYKGDKTGIKTNLKSTPLYFLKLICKSSKSEQ